MSSTNLIKNQYPLEGISNERLANICGAYHQNIKMIAAHFRADIKIQHHRLTIISENEKQIKVVLRFFDELLKHSDNPISTRQLHLLLPGRHSNHMTHSIKLNRKLIQAKNDKQAQFLDGMEKNEICFAVGPAGTGKTYLAVAKAIEAYERGEVQRLIFVRPAVEAGEKLGFLPGDLVEKVLPYLRPIYDSLYEMIGFKETQKLIQTDVIEVLPLAFMRGRTLNEAFIILDEAQNTSIAQMKMFLTRIGFGSKTVITGDMTQVDLPKGTASGLSHAAKLLQDVDSIGIYRFNSKEVVRHPLVSLIIDRYEQDSGEEEA